MAEKKKSKVVAKAKVKDEDKKPKSPAEEPDEFIAGVNRWATALRPHAFKIAGLVGLLAALLIGWAVYSWLGQRKAAKWTSAFAEVAEVGSRPVVAPDQTDGGVPTPDPTAKPDESFASAELRAEAVLAAAKKVEGSDGVNAATELLRARQLMVLGRHDDAVTAFAKVASSKLPKPVVVSAREGIGYAYEAKAEAIKDTGQRQAALEQALKAFADMQPAEDGPRRDWSMFHQARVLATLGKNDEAKALYEKILTTLPDSNLKPQVEVRLVGLGSK